MKGFWNKIWDEFVYGGHILSFGNVSIIYALSVIIDQQTKLIFYLIIYFGTLAVYKLDRFRDIASDFSSNRKRSELFLAKTQIKYEITLSLILTFLLTVIYGNQSSIIFVVILLLLGLGYSYIFKSISKKIAGFKNFFVPLPYALLPIFFILFHDINLSLGIFLFVIFTYLRLWAAVLFYDIKDINTDTASGVITLAVKLGVKKTYFWTNLLSYASILILLLAVVLKAWPAYSLIFILLPLYFNAYLAKSKSSKDISAFSHMLCDGEYIFWGILIAIDKNLWN